MNAKFANLYMKNKIYKDKSISEVCPHLEIRGHT